MLRNIMVGSVIVTIGLLSTACGIAPAPASVAQAQPTYTILPTYTPLPTSTAYPPQPTYTPLATATIPLLPTMTVAETVGTIPPSGSGDRVAQMLVALNQRRAEAKCPSLVSEPRLQAAAQAHAVDIAGRRKVDHLGADGATLEQRLQRVGYPFARRSETIAVGHAVSPLAIVDIWLNEPPDGPHRSSVLNCDYRDVGVGAMEAEPGVWYWVVDYAQPKTP